MEAKTAYERELDNLRATELRLGLPGTEEEPQKPAAGAAAAPRGTKRALAEVDEEIGSGSSMSSCTGSAGSSCTQLEDHFPEADAPPAAKEQVVGWPPIRSYRKNCLEARQTQAEAPGLYVKVSMDGAPYLRKTDLNAFRGYKELREAMEGMFKCYSIGFSAGEAQATADYAITYEDKDGDWMLAGDVPWEMFTSSCRRLRVMKGSEARGFGSSS